MNWEADFNGEGNRACGGGVGHQSKRLNKVIGNKNVLFDLMMNELRSEC